MKICMFVKNSFEYDARVTRAAKKLIEQGHEVTVIALFSRGLNTHETTPDGIKVVRVYRYPFGGDLILKLLRDKPKTNQTPLNTPTNPTDSNGRGSDGTSADREATATTTADPGLASVSTATTADIDDTPTGSPALVGEPSEKNQTQASQSTPAITTSTTPTVQTNADEEPGLIKRTFRFGYRLLQLIARQRFRTYRLLRGFTRKTRRKFWRGWRFFWWGVMKALRLQGRAIRTYAINRRMIREGLASGADIYHAHDVNTLWVATQCKKKTGIPLIYDTHEFATERNRMGWWWRKRETWNERRGLAHTDGLIVVTPDWIPRLKRLYGKIPPHWVTVTNVPETREINTRDLRGALGIHNGHKILVYQGSIQENRGIEPAIEAVKLLDNVVLVVIGYGYHRPRLEEIVEHQGLEGKVKFFGPIPHPQLLDWTSAGDIGMCNFVNSSVSYFTSVPNKLSEYMMAGLPVIGSDSPGIGSIIEEQGSGITVDPLSGTQIAEAVRTILADPEPFKEAARKAVERYNWDVESRNLVELYDKIIPLAKPTFISNIKG